MPFTFAHPAIVLPLGRWMPKYVSLTGLIAGSMIPDAEYFIRFRVLSLYSHTPAGIFWLDLPLALLGAFLFHLLVRIPLIDHLPGWLRSRLLVYHSFNWPSCFRKKWLVVIISILLGIASHLLWDGFTHEHGFFVQRWATLGRTLTAGPVSVPGYKLLQHTSTAAGLCVIACYVFRLPAKTPEPAPGNVFSYWSGIVLLAGMILLLRILCGDGAIPAGTVVVSAIAAFLAALMIISGITGRKRSIKLS